ncbi:MAG: DNA repair protein RecO [Deltaproteobacteria bacterium]|nr:DNA repair protein RecO [Deltaproteobacteria bacterium]
MLTTDAIIIKTVNYKETDKILTLFTLKMGIISVIAKGARKSMKRFGGALEPFALFEAVIQTSKKNSLHVLHEAKSKKTYLGLATDLKKLSSAAYILEMVNITINNDIEENRMFELVINTIELINSSEQINIRATVISFNLRLLSMNGFEVSTSLCSICGKQLPDNRAAYFNPQKGGITCTACGGGPILLNNSSTSILKELSKIPVFEASQRKFNSEQLQDIEQCMDLFIKYHLEKEPININFRSSY